MSRKIRKVRKWKVIESLRDAPKLSELYDFRLYELDRLSIILHTC